jgi:hypothetical protein
MFANAIICGAYQHIIYPSKKNYLRAVEKAGKRALTSRLCGGRTQQGNEVLRPMRISSSEVLEKRFAASAMRGTSVF